MKRSPMPLNCEVVAAKMTVMMIETMRIAGNSKRRCPSHRAAGDAPLLPPILALALQSNPIEGLACTG